MYNVLKIAGGLVGGGLIVATAVSNPSENFSPPIQNDVVIEVPKNKPNNEVEIEKPSPTIKTTTKVKEVTKTPEVKKEVVPVKPVSSCHPSYSGCLKMNAGDYDCAGGKGNGPNYTEAVQVYGSDPFDLDRDSDGWGCE